jgi:hypothetical protein
MQPILSPSLIVLSLMLAAPASAQDQQAPQNDPAAMAALDRMGAALRKHMEVNVRTDFTAEDVLMSGQKLQYGGTIEMVARRPDKLRISLKMGTAERDIYYDGKTVTLAAPTLGVYATTDAPPTIKEMLDQAADKIGIEIPLADLFMWGADPTLAERVTSAFPAGKETIGGQNCEHYAMRQPNVDWQVWIREGADALPCKMVITMTDDPAMPQFSALYHWSSAPPPGPEAYTYKAPEGHNQISFEIVTIKAASKGN